MWLVRDRDRFREWLQAERESRGWSQNELAKKAGMGRSIINKIELGQTDPLPKTLIALSRAFGYPVQRLYRLVGYLPSEPNTDPITEEGVHILHQLEGDDKEEAIRYLRLRIQIQAERGAGGRVRKARAPAT